MSSDDVDEQRLPQNGEFLLYQTEDGQTRIEVKMDAETVWLTLKQMAQLFQIDKSGISRHLKNIYETGELERDPTVAIFTTVQKEGDRTISRELEYYNLDAIISVGYRVNSIRGTKFHIWATKRLKEYIIKGFVLDDERLKQARAGHRPRPVRSDNGTPRLCSIASTSPIPSGRYL